MILLSQSILSILLMSSQDSVQKRVGQNAARNDLLILQTSLWLFLASGYASVQYTYRARGETRKHAPNDQKYVTSHISTNTLEKYHLTNRLSGALLGIGSLTFLGEWLARFPSIKAVWSSHGCLGNYQLPKHLLVQFVSQCCLSSSSTLSLRIWRSLFLRKCVNNFSLKGFYFK